MDIDNEILSFIGPIIIIGVGVAVNAILVQIWRNGVNRNDKIIRSLIAIGAGVAGGIWWLVLLSNPEIFDDIESPLPGILVLVLMGLPLSLLVGPILLFLSFREDMPYSSSPSRRVPQAQSTPTSPPPKPAAKFCTSCGAENPIDNAFCEQCGEPFES